MLWRSVTRPTETLHEVQPDPCCSPNCQALITLLIVAMTNRKIFLPQRYDRWFESVEEISLEHDNNIIVGPWNHTSNYPLVCASFLYIHTQYHTGICTYLLQDSSVIHNRDGDGHHHLRTPHWNRWSRSALIPKHFSNTKQGRVEQVGIKV